MSRAEYGSTWACVATAAPNLGKIFSLRRIVVAPGDEDQVTKKLMKTASEWEGVTRPGLVPITDCVESAGRVGIVSDYVEGEPLRTVLNLAGVRKMSIPQPVAFRILTDLVQALVNLLGAALKKPDLSKTMHGGLLPDVVLLTASGETRISEPGVTAEIVAMPVLAQHEKLIAYLTPEQLSEGKVDARTDVFTLGVILWEILAGKGLFLSEDEGRTSDTVRKRVIDFEVPRLDDPLLAIQPPVDKALADVVERALEKQASDRFPSLQDFATALRKAVGTRAGTRKDVATFLSGLIGSTIDTRRAAIDRASLGTESRSGHSSQDPMPTGGADTDIEFGDGDDLSDDLEELKSDAGHRTPPPRVDIRPARPSPPGQPGGNKPGVPRPQAGSPQPPVVAPVPKVELAPDDQEEPTQVEKKASESAEEKSSAEPIDIPPPSAVVLSTNPFEQPFETPAAPEEGKPEPEAPADLTPPPAGLAETPAPASGEHIFATESIQEKSPEPLAAHASLAVADSDLTQERKRKLTFIVGGVVGVAALLLIVGLIVSMAGGDEESTSDVAPELSAAVPVQEPTPPELEPKPEPEPEVVVEAGPEAEAEVEAGPEAAPEAPEAAPKEEPPTAKTAKPVAPKVPKPYKPKPKPYVPSGI
jgi:serine/threonine-protein kinase